MRAVLIFFYGLLLVRIAGRRVFGRWSAIDIVVSIVIGSNLSRALTGNAPLWGTLAATTLLMALHYGLAHAAVRMRWVSRLIEGAPICLADAGKADERAMRRQGVSLADLHEALRDKGLEHVAQTRLINLEPSGNVTVLKSD
ncbi:MAG TPA: YetF domain-containing protein [Allosphingosinicella sp.]|uniref:DUF421 domain-containing protein n=1 Tax=Allosphingosinicella sp. TaxID=2823234 RepID=UPI002F29EA65